MEARIDGSVTLIDLTRRRARRQVARAAAMSDRVERQFAHDMRHRSEQYDAMQRGERHSRADVLQAAVHLATSLFPGCHAASITTVSGDNTSTAPRYATAAHTGAAAIIDAAQYALDEGPCVEAVTLDHVTVIGADDLTSHNPPIWPRFHAAARHLGIRSAISIGIPWTSYWTGPADPDHPPVGAINLYAATPQEFLANETRAIALGVHLGARLTGADPAELTY